MASASITVTAIARVYHSTMAMFFALWVLFFAYIAVRLITQGAWIYAGATLLLALSIAAIGMSQISRKPEIPSHKLWGFIFWQLYWPTLESKYQMI